MPSFKLVSSDSHVAEPPAAWERVQREYGDRAPRYVKDPPGLPAGLFIVVDDLNPINFSNYSVGIFPGFGGMPEGVMNMDVVNWESVLDFHAEYTFEAYPEAWEPNARLAAQDRDGVESEVLFSSPARFFYGLTDEPFQRACFRSYNAWLHEFCSVDPQRLVGLPLISILDMDHAVKDIHEYAELGFKGVMIPTCIRDGGYYEPQYEPLWAALSETGLVVNVHTTSTQGAQQRREKQPGPRVSDPRVEPIGRAVSEQSFAEQFIGNLVFSGLLDRYPNVKVVCAEFDAGWVARMYQKVDYWFARGSIYDSERNLYKRKPSEYLRDNVYFTFQDDRAAVLASSVYGENNFLWASDFPHGATTWPYSPKTVEQNFKGTEPGLAKRICHDNAAGLYGLELS